MLNEIIRIPVIDYLAVFILAGLFWLGLWLARVYAVGGHPRLRFRLCRRLSWEFFYIPYPFIRVRIEYNKTVIRF